MPIDVPVSCDEEPFALSCYFHHSFQQCFSPMWIFVMSNESLNEASTFGRAHIPSLFLMARSNDAIIFLMHICY